MTTRVTEGARRSTLARACTPLTKSEEKERLRAVYAHFFTKLLFSVSFKVLIQFGHPLNMDTSLLRAVCFVPGERKPLHFLYIQPA